MYEKNLNDSFRLRLNSDDMEFLKFISSEYNISVSEIVRNLICNYRLSYLNMEGCPDGDTKTNINNII